MSKHDQVTVPGLSLHGRTGIPKCVACDRPLPVKKRLEEFSKMDDDGEVQKSPPTSARRSQSGKPESTSSRRLKSASAASSRPTNSTASAPTMPMGAQGPYIYRGGFKMPRPTTSGGLGSKSLPRLQDVGTIAGTEGRVGLSVWSADRQSSRKRSLRTDL